MNCKLLLQSSLNAFCLLTGAYGGFCAHRTTGCRVVDCCRSATLSFLSANANANSNNNENDNDINERVFRDALNQRVEQINVEKTRNELEAANVQSFLKRVPLKLPYDKARRWVQANLGCDTKEEFFDLAANGNIRSSYLPKNPEAYYTRTNSWISWDHFLKGLFDDEQPSGVKPQSGVFD
jgi:hypothetical protein